MKRYTFSLKEGVSFLGYILKLSASLASEVSAVHIFWSAKFLSVKSLLTV